MRRRQKPNCFAHFRRCPRRGRKQSFGGKLGTCFYISRRNGSLSHWVTLEEWILLPFQQIWGMFPSLLYLFHFGGRGFSCRPPIQSYGISAPIRICTASSSRSAITRSFLDPAGGGGGPGGGGGCTVCAGPHFTNSPVHSCPPW